MSCKLGFPSAPLAKPVAKKGLPQDRFGGYADWDELDEAPDEEEDYYSDESDEAKSYGH